jgi:hypothetical protein
VFFQPLDETAGKLTYVSVPPASSLATSGATVNGASPQGMAGTVVNDAAIGTRVWIGSVATLTASLQTLDNTSFDTISTTAQTTEWLKATNYGFAVPTGSTIVGIQVNVYYAEDTAAAYTTSVRLSKASTVQAGAPATSVTTNWHPLDPSGRLLTSGGPTDLWGAAWTASDINNTGFGAAFSYASTLLQQLEVTYIGMIVYYTLGAGFTVARDAVIYASKTAELRTEGMFRSDAGGTIYAPVSQVTGDLPRVPPSGLESRPVQVFVKPTRGDLSTLADSGLDSLSVIPKVCPSYLFRP